MDKEINKIVQLILASKNCIALTGAGVSTESGIPDFRSPESGLWTKIDPMEVFSGWGFQSNPSRFYELGLSLLPKIMSAQPNAAHRLLALLEERNLLKAVITQNIDGLHQKAGSKNVLELHGNISTGKCQTCGKEYSVKEIVRRAIKRNLVPLCHCGGIIKPDIVLFGDMLPEAFEFALQYCQTCDLMLLMGSSLEVFPACELPRIALDTKAKLIILNRSKTQYDRYAEVVIHEDLEKICNQISTSFKRIVDEHEIFG